MRYIVDRIEGNFAVCENDEKKMINIPVNELPINIKEGNVIEYNNGIYTINKEEEKNREYIIKEKMNNIWNN